MPEDNEENPFMQSDAPVSSDNPFSTKSLNEGANELEALKREFFEKKEDKKNDND